MTQLKLVRDEKDSIKDRDPSWKPCKTCGEPLILHRDHWVKTFCACKAAYQEAKDTRKHAGKAGIDAIFSGQILDQLEIAILAGKRGIDEQSAVESEIATLLCDAQADAAGLMLENNNLSAEQRRAVQSIFDNVSAVLKRFADIPLLNKESDKP